MKLKRLGMRKVAAKAVDTKVGRGADAVVSVPLKKGNDLLNYVGRKTGLNKLKVDASGKRQRKSANASLQEKMEKVQRNNVEQEAKQIDSMKKFERERDEGLAQIEYERNNRFPADDVHVPRDGGRL